MTTVAPVPLAVVPAQRGSSGNCVKCRRAPGRPRAPQPTGDGLIVATELRVCDRCWHTAGGEAAVQAVLDETGEFVLTLHGSDAFETWIAAAAAASAAQAYDRRHPIERLLLESGIRWAVLRYIATPARCDLVRLILERVPPAHTRASASPDAWVDTVEEHIEYETGPGREFRYTAKRRRWLRIVHVLRCCSDTGRRPLTWVAQEEIAAAVGCSTRTVRRCVAWLQREGLLFEIVPGTQVPRQVVPDEETSAEQDEREARSAAAEATLDAVADARRARINAELDAVRQGLGGGDALAVAEGEFSPADDAAFEALLAAAAELEPGLIQLCPVYELREPLPAAQLAEEAAIARARTMLETPGEIVARHYAAELVAGSNAHVYRELWAIGHDGVFTRMTGLDAAWALTSGNAVGLLRTDEFGHPPQVITGDEESNSAQPVDNRPASPGSDQGSPLGLAEKAPDSAAAGLTAPSEGKPAKARQSEAWRAAEWLIGSRLHPDLCEDVSVRWLAAVIRGSKLLTVWGEKAYYGKAAPVDPDWHAVPDAWNELADLIEGMPEYAHLPHHIRNPRKWIRRRIRNADPLLPPSKLKIMRPAKAGLSQAETDRVAAALRRAKGRSLRDAIAACPICDEHGWFHADPRDATAPDIRCNHNPATGGW